MLSSKGANHGGGVDTSFISPNNENMNYIPFKQPLLQDIEIDMQNLTNYFLPYKHYNYVIRRESPLILTVREGDGWIQLALRKSSGPATIHSVDISQEGDIRGVKRRSLWGKSNKDKIKEVIRSYLQSIGEIDANDTIYQVSDNSNFTKSLLKTEERLIISRNKIGLIYAKRGQRTFEEFLLNNYEDCNAGFWTFASFLGTFILLRSWGQYSGGLDVTNDLTGSTSYFTKWQQLEIMFHVSPLIASNPKDPQQIERKRFIGNDQVIVVYREDPSTNPTTFLDLDSFSSKQNHVVIIIDPIPNDINRFTISLFQRKCMPLIPKFEGEPIKYSMEKSIHRDYLLSKIILSERLSYQSSLLSPLMDRTKSQLYWELINTL